MTDDWVPLGIDRAALAEQHEGIPPWMATRFWPWLESTTNAVAQVLRLSRTDLVAEYDERARLNRPLAPSTSYDLAEPLRNRSDDGLALRYTDFLLMKLVKAGGSPDTLEHILSRAGSAWRAGSRDGFAGLERRVPLGIQEAAEAVMAKSGDAGKLLSEAWHALFKIDPDHEEAYEKAIKAVEEAGASKVAPKNDLTTLGTMARDMEAQKTWALPLGDNRTPPSTDAVTKMVRLLWEGQESRHGGNGYRKPTPEEAESAVFLAVSLVQFFYADLVKRR